MSFRRRLSTKQRKDLYDREVEKAREAGRGDFPICNLCDAAILPGSTWDESHPKHKPHWLGGTELACAHTRCNRRHNNEHDTPLFAKSERTIKKNLDIPRSRTPVPGGRDDTIGKRMSGEVFKR